MVDLRVLVDGLEEQAGEDEASEHRAGAEVLSSVACRERR